MKTKERSHNNYDETGTHVPAIRIHLELEFRIHFEEQIPRILNKCVFNERKLKK